MRFLLRRLRVPIMSYGIVSLLLACHPTTAQTTSALQLSVELPDTLPANQSLPLHLVLRNRSQAAVDLELVGSPVRRGSTIFNVIVTAASGSQVWQLRRRPSAPPGVAVAITSVAALRQLGPQQALDWWAVWDLRDAAGQPVSPGNYRVLGVVPLDRGDSLVSTPRLLTIVP